LTLVNGPPAGFFARRWRGEVAWRRLFWRDMLGAGTLVNVLATLVALAMATQDLPLGYAALVHFAPVPYNLFLFAALTRAPGRTGFGVAAGVAWLVLVSLV
jgi:hypothetical protein